MKVCFWDLDIRIASSYLYVQIIPETIPKTMFYFLTQQDARFTLCLDLSLQ